LSINSNKRVKVYAALPVLNELENLPVVVSNILEQEDVDLELIVCVNQPNEWHDNDEKVAICHNNKLAIEYLESLDDSRITVIDKSTGGNGWIGSDHGVGWARKTAMDLASSKAGDDDIIVSIDADTFYTSEYFRAIVDAFERFPGSSGLSVPYYHPLTGDELADRCILRYELYMRNYALNMLLIKNPYSFSAIGSGMACKGSMYRKVRGLTPKMSGEDFYFVQKLRKAGKIIVDCEEVIYPASRFSDRVYFGTGPAMIKGAKGNWDSYPIYSQDLFLELKATYDLFPVLFNEDVPTPMDTFLSKCFKVDICELWKPLRANCRDEASFIKAATQKVDGLRILQFLKDANHAFQESEEYKLVAFLNNNLEPSDELKNANDQLLMHGFEGASIASLNLIRDMMFVNERRMQKQYGTV
jgi:glycosyltransferase involved in cell wall biosynthesis